MPEPDREQQERQAAQAIEMMETHREFLAEDARDLLALHPDARVVGLILSADSEEMASLRPALEPEIGESMAGKGFVGLMPRDVALAILRKRAPSDAGLDRARWRGAVAPHGRNQGRLPVRVGGDRNVAAAVDLAAASWRSATAACTSAS